MRHLMLWTLAVAVGCSFAEPERVLDDTGDAQSSVASRPDAGSDAPLGGDVDAASGTTSDAAPAIDAEATIDARVLFDIGVACNVNDQCESGFCVDGVCCATACDDGACTQCDLDGARGTCTPVQAGMTCGASRCINILLAPEDAPLEVTLFTDLAKLWPETTCARQRKRDCSGEPST